MSDIHPMKKPWSVVGAGFNDEGVYFNFDDTAIHREDINLMQSAPELLKELEETHAALCFTPDYIGSERYERNKAAIAKALGQ